MTITEFLTARLDEDEHVVVALRTRTAPRRHPRSWRADLTTDEQGNDGITISPERMLADIAAKRAIMEFAAVVDELAETVYGEFSSYPDGNGDKLLCLLAQPYTEHPDYDEAWRT